MSNRKDELDDIARMAPGPERRRILFAEFGPEISAATAFPSRLGCTTLLALLGADTRLGPQRAPAPDPEAE